MNTFYTPDDHPSKAEKEFIWASVASEMALQTHRKNASVSFHWKSFLIGNAAAVLLFLSVIGAYSIYKEVNQVQVPQALKVESAYDEALRQLVAISPEVKAQASESQRSVIESRLSSIEDIDMMIQEIRNDMLIHGSSEMKRHHLRRLYATKMDYMKDLLLSGEVNL